MAKTIEEALEQAQEWLRISGVEGIAQGEQNGQPCIIVFTSRPVAEISSLLPDKLSGFPVVLQESGIVHIQ